ncbi:hypothetical protein ACFE04_007505 [Oxalis oulophora]
MALPLESNIQNPSIDSVESSLISLVKTWNRIQKWHLFFTHGSDQQILNLSPWRINLTKFLESTPVRLVAILLLLLDLISTILEVSSTLISCPLPEKHDLYHWVGIGILSTLSIKTFALAIGLGISFFKRPGYVIDCVVLIGALLLETFLGGKGGGLLMVASLWRILRVVESAFELSDEAIEARIENIMCQFEALREENVRLLESIVGKDKIIEKLKEELEECSCNNSVTL